MWNRESEVAGPGIYIKLFNAGVTVVHPVGPSGEPMQYISELSTQKMKVDICLLVGSHWSRMTHGS